MFPIITVKPGHPSPGQIPAALNITNTLSLVRTTSTTSLTITDLSHGDVEGSLSLSQSSRNVDTVDVAVEPLAEDHPIERPIELDPDSEEILLALNLQVFDLSHIGRLTVGPGIGS